MRLTTVFLPLVTLALSITASASKVVDLDATNFDKHVGVGKPALVEFFAPWVSRLSSMFGVQNVELITIVVRHSVGIASKSSSTSSLRAQSLTPITIPL